MNIFRIKNLEAVIKSVEKSELKKTLSAFDLIMMGIGAIIGVGVFVIIGAIAAKYSGPAITVSFLIACLVCIVTALAYSELAAMIPTSGGAYSYCYVTLGEVFAWIVGCLVCMMLIFGAAAVAVGWSGYVIGILQAAGVNIPLAITAIPEQGGMINLPAIIITLIISLLLIRGTKESALVNTILVVVKMAAIGFFIVVALPSFNLDNWANFMPFGFDGVVVGAASLFLAYTGFDAVATAAEECKNPNRDLPIGIIGSLVISGIIYVVVSGILTGIVPYFELNNAEPMAYALRKTGSNIGSLLVAVGAVTGMTTVLIVQIYATSRVLYSIARDGLLPKILARLHSKFSTPVFGILLVGSLIALIVGFFPLATINNITSLSVLCSFVFVALAAMKMRIKHPEVKRPFKCPYIFVIAPISIIACIYLIQKLIYEVGIAFILCLVVALVFYFVYGIKHSELNKVSIFETGGD
ncbi:amino acid permease [Rickettsiales endosymbiont of Stachyamoeba lipophora]|uniref:amino acid permease n=1 Tax=Rickettsiales endosymbiont of Stachyamoeba lipophora TaxID=2486578 RepID=UPI000F6526F4|nr:amino acid permease [Rickettsiales endosymbiont of Stachyamoeba lipophora]AZL15263.1 amino acid permease [Rickettsiales endosymbiont of Stachyamoeba lipophora]